MNASKYGRRGPRLALAMIAVAEVCAAHAHAHAAEPADNPVSASQAPRWPEADTVDELLRRETRAALAAQGRRQGWRDPSIPPESPEDTEPRPDNIDLAAIYGIGKKLDVEVLVNGWRLRYRHGRKWPDEAPGGEGVYALRAIEGRCVKLDRAGIDRQVCLSVGN